MKYRHTVGFAFWTAMMMILPAFGSYADDEIAELINEAEDNRADSAPDYTSLKDLAMLQDSLRSYQTMDEPSEAVFNNDNNIIPGLVRKRPFCNGFFGCGRVNGKRSSSMFLQNRQLTDTLHESPSNVLSSYRSKRPFCNGFFGCGNPGKRIVFRTPKGYTSASASGEVSTEKRFFCNPGAFGCQNPGKRNLPATWLRSMRTLINEA